MTRVKAWPDPLASLQLYETGRNGPGDCVRTMSLNLKLCSADFASLTPQETAALLARANALRDARRAGTIRPALAGKNIGLLCGVGAGAGDIELVTSAVAALGARVAHIGSELPSTSTSQLLQASARLLGRLYDAVICIGIEPTLVRRIGESAGIPVFDDFCTPEHPTAALADAWGSSSPDTVAAESATERPSLLIQAVLLDALS